MSDKHSEDSDDTPEEIISSLRKSLTQSEAGDCLPVSQLWDGIARE
ncbi:hypothetical protein [Synechococcus sp. PCC 7336]|nr:hypothetical protein [Synechococcus sp. PCC 7336]